MDTQFSYEKAKNKIYPIACKMWSTIDLGEQLATDRDFVIAGAYQIEKLERSLARVIQIIEEEPLGYIKADEHEKLEDFACRILTKIIGKPYQL